MSKEMFLISTQGLPTTSGRYIVRITKGQDYFADHFGFRTMECWFDADSQQFQKSGLDANPLEFDVDSWRKFTADDWDDGDEID